MSAPRGAGAPIELTEDSRLCAVCKCDLLALKRAGRLTCGRPCCRASSPGWGARHPGELARVAHRQALARADRRREYRRALARNDRRRERRRELREIARAIKET